MPIEKLVELKEIKGTLELKSGLHVGVGRDHIEIGGIDLPVIKDAVTDTPYIPGSSLKGKLRSLL
ncbi:type III-A CRISPR-associated RAMP protein Csm3, partial [bacterium]|nr:type III-A CRISPR-associated RAMP protein Csm3 [bacterium]